jgi:HEPN domain-containing protein
MDLNEIEKYWIDSSLDAFDTAETLLKNKRFAYAMFFLHLSIEKMLKALFVNKNNTESPFGHNLQNIAAKIKDINFGKERMELFTQITTFNIAGRYAI